MSQSAMLWCSIYVLKPVKTERELQLKLLHQHSHEPADFSCFKCMVLNVVYFHPILGGKAAQNWVKICQIQSKWGGGGNIKSKNYKVNS